MLMLRSALSTIAIACLLSFTLAFLTPELPVPSSSNPLCPSNHKSPRNRVHRRTLPRHAFTSNNPRHSPIRRPVRGGAAINPRDDDPYDQNGPFDQGGVGSNLGNDWNNDNRYPPQQYNQQQQPQLPRQHRYTSSSSSSSIPQKQRTAQSVLTSLPGISTLTKFANNNRQLGILLITLGTTLTLLGLALFFEKNLLRLGNLLFLAGLPLVIGPSRTASYFLQPKKFRATSCLGLGVLLVFWGRPIMGMCLEIFGVLNLFGNMFPVVFMMVKRMPVVGDLFSSGSGGSVKTNMRNRSYGDESNDDYNRRR